MVVQKGDVKKGAPKVQKVIKKSIEKNSDKKADKKSSDKAGVVSANFNVDETERYSGVCVHFNRKSGYGFVKLDTEGVVPGDKVMCYWKEIRSDDRWPALHKGLEVEMNLAKVKKAGVYSVIAKEVSAPGGENISFQEENEAKKEYVGDQNMRFLGNVKFFDFQKGFGYVKIQEGYDIDSDIPSEFIIHRTEINAGSDTPRLSPNMEIEFGIAKNSKGQYSCYNVTLPGGSNVTRTVVEEREIMGTGTHKGKVTMWAFQGGFGWIQLDSMKGLSKKVTEAIKNDHAKRVAKAKKNNKEAPAENSLYFRMSDRADRERLSKGDAVIFKIYTDKMGVGAADVKKA